MSFGDGAFTILDTPGFGAKDDPLKQGFLLQHALTCQPLNAIFIVIPFHSRVEENMPDRYDESIRCIRSNKEISQRIILIVTHFDQCPRDA